MAFAQLCVINIIGCFLFSVVSAMNKTVANSPKHDSVWSSTYSYPSQVCASAVPVHLTKWIILLNNANRGDLKHTLMDLESVIMCFHSGSRRRILGENSIRGVF